MMHTVTYIGTLSNLGEPATAAGSLGTGSVSLAFDDDTFMMTVNVTFSGLSGTSTASHIHCCTAAAGTGSAGVATPLPTFPGFPLGVTSGSYSQTFDLAQASNWNPAFIT
ncbi:MAG: CHRD domain-containing protein, partial [Burkholderiales bacterium]|nr:CHRD domain-containing protein [Burkholderiales bacterium]